MSSRGRTHRADLGEEFLEIRLGVPRLHFEHDLRPDKKARQERRQTAHVKYLGVLSTPLFGPRARKMTQQRRNCPPSLHRYRDLSYVIRVSDERRERRRTRKVRGKRVKRQKTGATRNKNRQKEEAISKLPANYGRTSSQLKTGGRPALDRSANSGMEISTMVQGGRRKDR